MNHQLTTPERRRGGEHGAQILTQEQRQAGGKLRASQPSHHLHNRTIARDGYWAWSIRTMRVVNGHPLAIPKQIHFLRLSSLNAHLVDQPPLTDEERRLAFGYWVWQDIWDGSPCMPPQPSAEEYLRQVERVRARISRGLPLLDVLDALYVAPDDFADEQGVPWSLRTQRKKFRDALRAAEHHIAQLNRAYWGAARQAKTSQRTSGQRRPMEKSSPRFSSARSPISGNQVERPDLPRYHRRNITPARPYGLPKAAVHHTQIVWLTPDETPFEDE